MAIDKNKIAAPVAITDPYNLLGIYPSNGVWDVADIVALERPLLQGGRPGRINKWSRHKPVRYPQAAPLSDNYPQQSGGVTTYINQWEGSETDKNQGIRYGLKATIPHGTNIVTIHDTSFEYVAYPHPGTDFCRLSDFDGYDHNAKPNLTGSKIDEISADVPYLFVDINYYDTSVNPTGVPVESWLALASDKSIGDYYPAILVTDGNGSSFARLLTNTSTNTVTTLRVGNVWYSAFKVKFFSDGTTPPILPVGQSDTFPGEDSIGANLKVTLFLIDKKSFEYWTGVDKQITVAVRISFPNGNPPVGEKYTFRISGSGFLAIYDYEYKGTGILILNIPLGTIHPDLPPGTHTYYLTCSVYGVSSSGEAGVQLDSLSKNVTFDIPDSGIIS